MEAGATLQTFNNNRSFSLTPGIYTVGIDVYGTIGTFNNNLGATIVSSIQGQPIYIGSKGGINLINNWGVIAGGSEGIYSEGLIGTINNFGSITYSPGGQTGIGNNGIITTLNNAQGGESALRMYGNLPVNYNIIVNSAGSYGKLSAFALNKEGTTTNFGISSYSAGSRIVSGTPYTSVLSGVTNTQLGILGITKSGTSNGYAYTLTETAPDSNIWDLIISSFYSGPSTASTQQSLVNTASALQSVYTLQNSVLANSFSYDCSLFGANSVCVSAGGRNTSVQGANGLNNTSALLITSYRLDKNNSRIGAYADQNLSVNNSGSTVTLGNNTPLIGLFGVWSQRADATGAEIKVSAAYGQKNTSITRQVVGDSEAGSGSSTLNSQGAQITAKYGFAVASDTVVSPYLGLRYTQNNMGGYTEGASSTVTAPLTYSALNTNATTVLAGVGARHLLTPKTMVMASAGVETDTNTANGSFAGTSSSIPGLSPVNFNANPVTTRPTASLGGYYMIEKNQRIGLTGIYRQEAYQSVSSTTVIATYTIGL